MRRARWRSRYSATSVIAGRSETSTIDVVAAGTDQLGDLGRHLGIDPAQERLDDGHGLGPEVVEVAVAVVADVEVDLNHPAQAEPAQAVDQQRDVDAVPLDERQPFEDLAATAVLARQRLAKPGEVGEQQ